MNEHLAKFYSKKIKSGDVVHPVEFYEFLFNTIATTALAEKMVSDQSDKEYHLTPHRICHIFSTTVKREYGAFARTVVDSWRVKSSKHIGEAIFDLAQFGCLKLSGNETMEDFENANLDI